MEHIHKINSSKEQKGEVLDSAGTTSSVIGYAEGLTEVDADSQECLAKSVVIVSEAGERHKYYVKVGSTGELFNPWGMYSEGTSNKFAKHRGKYVWNLVEVSFKSFDFYKQFLSSRNPAWLHNAQRESRNA